MRSRARLLALLLAVSLGAVLAACGDSSSSNPPDTPVFTITSPQFEVEAGQEITFCYYFRSTNTATFSVKEWSSTMPTGATSLAVVLTDTDLGTPGTLTTSGCGLAPFDDIAPVPVYLARSTTESFTFPASDGAGQAVGMTLPADQPGYVRIHVANPTDATITGTFVVTADGYETGTAVTRADPYVAYNGFLSLPPGNQVTTTINCPFPTDDEVFALTTHTHRYSTSTSIADGPTILFQSDDWTDPGLTTSLAPPFLEVATGQLSLTCDYTNPGGTTITAGDDETTNEVCMAVVWSFPTTEPTYCFNGTVL
jgi:hypothetical protein